MICLPLIRSELLLPAVLPVAAAAQHLAATLPPGDVAWREEATQVRRSADKLLSPDHAQECGANSAEELALLLLKGRSCLNLACTCLRGPTEAGMKTKVRGRRAWGCGGG